MQAPVPPRAIARMRAARWELRNCDHKAAQRIDLLLNRIGRGLWRCPAEISKELHLIITDLEWVGK